MELSAGEVIDLYGETVKELINHSNSYKIDLSDVIKLSGEGIYTAKVGISAEEENTENKERERVVQYAPPKE